MGPVNPVLNDVDTIQASFADFYRTGEELTRETTGAGIVSSGRDRSGARVRGEA